MNENENQTHITENAPKEPTPSWKFSIIFGLIDLGAVFLRTHLGIILLSTAMIILIACGIAVTPKFIKDDWQNGFKVSAVLCVVGLLMHISAAALYAATILIKLVSMFAS